MENFDFKFATFHAQNRHVQLKKMGKISVSRYIDGEFTELKDFKSSLIQCNYDEDELVKLYIQKMKEPYRVKMNRYDIGRPIPKHWFKKGRTYYAKTGYEKYTDKKMYPIVLEKIKGLIKMAEELDPSRFFYADKYSLIEDLNAEEPLNVSDVEYINDLRNSIIKSINKMEEIKEFKLQEKENKKLEVIREKERKINEKKEIEEYNNIKPKIELRYNEGIEFFNSSKFPNAIYSYSEAIKLDVNNKYDKDLYFNRGNAKFEVGDFLGSIIDMDKSINLKGTSNIKLFNKGHAQFKIKKFNEAVNSFNELLALDSSYKEALFFRGLSKLNLEQKEEGCLDLSKAGELGYFEAYDEIKKHCTEE